LIDRRIGLQKIFEAPVAETRRAAFGADDSGGKRLTDAQGVADGKRDIAYPHTVGIA
jgi:hypothetical protein